MAGSIVQNALSARAAAMKEGDDFRTDRARLTAGNALKAGDYGAASGALYGSGDLAGGQDVQQQGARIKGATAFAAKDYTGAREAFAGVGDVANVSAVDGAEQGQKKQAYEFMQQAAKALEAELDAGGPEAVAQSYDRLAPVFAKLPGATPESIAQTREMLTGPNAKAAFAALNRAVAKELQFFEGPDGIYAADKTTGAVERKMDFAPKREPKWVERSLPDGSTEWFDLNAEAGGGVAPASGPPSAAPGGAGFEAVIAPLLDREGGFVARDGRSGAPANFGINQRANPDIDVKNLTREKAIDLYRDRYWNVIRGDELPAEAQAAVFDAAVNQGPQKALQMWGASGQDLGEFNRLRQEHYRSLPDYAENGKSWERRVQETGGGAAQAPGRGVRGSAPKAADWVELAGPEAASYGTGRWQKNSRTGEVKQVSGTDQRKQEPTIDAKKTVAFAYRTLRANDRLNALIEEGVTKPSAWKLVSEKNGASRLIVNNQNDRRFLSAAKEWLAPILRKDTGAAVTDTEFLYYADMYIPAPEDGPELLKQKAEARQDAMIALANEAGPLYTRTHGRREFKARWAPTPKGAQQPAGKPGAKPTGGKPSLADIFGGR